MTATPEDPIGFVIVDVARQMRRHYERRLEASGLGLTVAEARTLAFTARRPGLRQAVLAEELCVEPMTLVGFLDRLENQGLIERVPDPTDRRAKLIRPTAAAAPLVRRIRAVGKVLEEEGMRHLDAAAVAALRQALLGIQANLNTPAEEPA